MCKVVFSNNSLSKYMEVFEKNNIPYVVYGYMLEDTYGLKVEIEGKNKKHVKLGANVINQNEVNNIEMNNRKREIYAS